MTRDRLTNIISGIYGVLIFGFIFLPVIVLVLFSFQDGRLPVPPFNGFSLQWYEAVFADRKLMSALLHSLLVATSSSFLACLLGFLAAYALARFKLPGSILLRGLLIAPMTVSYLIIALGLLTALNVAGIGLSLWTVGIGHVVINLPLCFAIIYSSMGDHHINIERAARDLGASDIKVMALVTAPMLLPSLFASFFLSMTFSWDEFIIAFLLSRFDVTLPVEIWSLLRSGLNPKTNAIGSLVFLVSVTLLVVLEVFLFGRTKKS
ncbi:ABC transporter permease [Rhizobium mesoamericanum]|uniref:Spermidine/putrescine transport system permease protein n=1 Tax=Rhizobium mesoamericanum STM3625 TaxID=1211777 RepID=K0PXD7_9HYPH|nr:ABC transporter permease [Rhizobium mesoamericanum]CCM78513.1 Spermidine/putrescine transport system permease protein [Rhizobium mesoamericanum STM3625]